MCFYYALSQQAQRLKNRYQIKFDFEFEPVFYTSGFDYPKMPVITNVQPDRIQELTWGLIPYWVKTPTEAMDLRTHTLNARIETASTKPSFRHAIKQKRCLVPAGGFYEWRECQGKKYPYYIYLKSQAIFSFAGIWDEWIDRETGEVLKTFSILTTQANPLLEKIHNTKKRMPVILPENRERDWLRNDLNSEEILALAKPFDENLMEAHTVSKLITSRTENRNAPAIQDVNNYPGLSSL